MPTANMHFSPLDETALTAILGDWRRQYPEMGVLALLPEAEQRQLPLLQAVCRQLAVPLVGGIFPALLTADGFITQGVCLLRFDHMVPARLVPELVGLTADPVGKITAALAEMLPGLPSEPKPTLYLLFDGLIPNIASIVDGLYLALADRVCYAGVNAGSETFTSLPCLFDAEQVIADGALLMLLPGPGRSLLEHGYPASERVMSATSTVGNRINQIDWQPAFAAYQEIIRQTYDIALTADNFYEYAVHFPLGILRANGEVVVRIPVGLADDGSVFCVGEVPENAMLVLLRAPPADAEGCIEQLAGELEEVNGALAGRSLLAFYCAGRRMHLGAQAVDEIGRLRARLQPGLIAGALSLGEIGGRRDWDYPMFHNAALVCTPWDPA